MGLERIAPDSIQTLEKTCTSGIECKCLTQPYTRNTNIPSLRNIGILLLT